MLCVCVDSQEIRTCKVRNEYIIMICKRLVKMLVGWMGGKEGGGDEEFPYQLNSDVVICVWNLPSDVPSGGLHRSVWRTMIIVAHHLSHNGLLNMLLYICLY